MAKEHFYIGSHWTGAWVGLWTKARLEKLTVSGWTVLLSTREWWNMWTKCHWSSNCFTFCLFFNFEKLTPFHIKYFLFVQLFQFVTSWISIDVSIKVLFLCYVIYHNCWKMQLHVTWFKTNKIRYNSKSLLYCHGNATVDI